MKTSKEITDCLKTNNKSVGSIHYNTILNEFGEILVKVDDKDWQGDSRLVFRDENRFGFLIFGWGSCSGCDALLACKNFDDIEKLIDSLINSIKWFDSYSEVIDYFTNKDFDLEHYGRKNETKEFIKLVLEYTILIRDEKLNDLGI